MWGVQIMSVTGPVLPGDLGVVLPHEHVFADLVREYRGTGLLNDEHLACRELEAFAAAGGTTLVDLTLDEIGRNPPALRRVAEAAGVTIIMGCGHYRDPYLDRAWFDRHTVEAIADEMVRDVEEGVRDTGIRAGIIGEIGADKWYISAAEERSFRAAARAHRRTGLATLLLNELLTKARSRGAKALFLEVREHLQSHLFFAVGKVMIEARLAQACRRGNIGQRCTIESLLAEEIHQASQQVRSADQRRRHD